MQAALSKIRGGKPDLNNILDEEKKLFDSIVATLLQSRKNFFIKESPFHAINGMAFPQGKKAPVAF